MNPLTRIVAPAIGVLVGLTPAYFLVPARAPASVLVPIPREKPEHIANVSDSSVRTAASALASVMQVPEKAPVYAVPDRILTGAVAPLTVDRFDGGAAAAAPVPVPRPRPDLALATMTPRMTSYPAPAPAPKGAGAGRGDARVASLAPSAGPAQAADDATCLADLKADNVQFTVLPSNQSGACGLKQPLQLTASLNTNGVRFAPAAVMGCAQTRAVLTWLDKDVQPAAIARLGGPITAIQVADSYSCRSIDNIPGAKLSEHAKGNAIDISAFQVGSGKQARWVEVAARKNPNDPEALFLNEVRKAACQHFSTVLGPGQPDHDTHFHLDNARHDSAGTYRICE